MSNQLETIDCAALATVSGGADQGQPDIYSQGAGTNRFEATGNITASTPGVKVEGAGAVRTTTSNYAECLKSNAGLKGQDLVAACGLPQN